MWYCSPSIVILFIFHCDNILVKYDIIHCVVCPRNLCSVPAYTVMLFRASVILFNVQYDTIHCVVCPRTLWCYSGQVWYCSMYNMILFIVQFDIIHLKYVTILITLWSHSLLSFMLFHANIDHIRGNCGTFHYTLTVILSHTYFSLHTVLLSHTYTS